MQEAGAELVVHYNNLAVMGFIEVLFYLRKVWHYLKFCRRDIMSFQPDVVILIDFAGFNLRIASYLKKKGIRVYYYISPKIWAWNSGRAWKIKKVVDRMFVILPFEKEFYRQFNYDVDYVGNPVVDAVSHYNPNRSFLNHKEIFNKEKYIALLPGSRSQELKSVIPDLVQLADSFKDVQFIMAGISSLPVVLYAEVNKTPNIAIVFDKTYDVLAYAEAAVVTSGTATLETALWDIPQVVIYKSYSRINVWIGRMVIKVKFISLVNLIAGREVVRELIQSDLIPANLNAEVDKLIHNEDYRNRIFYDYAEIRNLLGREPVSEKAAALMMKYLKG